MVLYVVHVSTTSVTSLVRRLVSRSVASLRRRSSPHLTTTGGCHHWWRPLIVKSYVYTQIISAMKYYVIAGEPSGDLHGSKLMRGISFEDPEAKFRFSGGDRMADVAGRDAMLYHYTEMSFFGFVQVVKNLRTIFSQIDNVKADIERFSPDVIILIDYPAFNLSIA